MQEHAGNDARCGWAAARSVRARRGRPARRPARPGERRATATAPRPRPRRRAAAGRRTAAATPWPAKSPSRTRSRSTTRFSPAKRRPSRRTGHPRATLADLGAQPGQGRAWAHRRGSGPAAAAAPQRAVGAPARGRTGRGSVCSNPHASATCAAATWSTECGQTECAATNGRERATLTPASVTALKPPVWSGCRPPTAKSPPIPRRSR